MSDEVSAEAAGETVGEAKWAALRELELLAPGLARDAVRFEVLAEGERGLLGVGYAPARVRAVAARPDAPPFPREDEPEDASLVRELLQRVAAGIGVSCDVRVEEGDAEIRAELVGGDLGLVIGRHGQTIDAIQYLANAAVHRRYGADRRAVTVDAGGYRSRRSASLHRLAGSVAERVAATGRPATLEPMTAVERKIVHEYLKDDPEVETESDGTEPNRHVVVLPRRPL